MVNDHILEEINAQKRVYVQPIPQDPPPASLEVRKSVGNTLSIELKNRIQAYVAAHLYPYTSGEEMGRIYEDVEKKAVSEARKKKIKDAEKVKNLKEKLLGEAKKASIDAKPAMMKTLLKHLRKKDRKLSKTLDGKIQKYALHEYVKRAIHGLYQHLEIGNKVIIDPKEEEPITILENALKPALEHDFPDEAITEKALKKWIGAAFEEVNQKKCEKNARKVPSFFKEKRKSTRTKKTEG